MINNNVVACFPHMANYAYAFKYVCEKGFEVKYLIPPPISKKTLELGSKYSPDYVCSPFKYSMGCYLEALELGANCLMQIYGGCRLNYYGELNATILRDLGYEFEFFDMAAVNWRSRQSVFENFRKVNPEMSIVKVGLAIPVMLKIFETLDKFEDYIRRNVGFEINDGEFDATYKEFLKKLENLSDGKELKKLKREYWKKLNAIPIDKPAKTIKVGFVGDYFTVQEPFSNYFMEKELAKFGMEVYRQMNITCSVIHSENKKKRKLAKKYAKFELGATANCTVAEAIKFAKEGCAGIIQVKSFGCTPEVDAMPILQNVSRDFNIPILHFSFDSQTSETGVKTRIEAFYDMVEARSKK
ncbi:MAG: hypothetical protein NC099_06175 [Corallococcus sp.]|nr:hypothetical protein [Bacillota bacterium]MCM1534219.1 hypothetical protein [Corallococcus sp.]